MKQCPYCSEFNNDSARFCVSCGKALPVTEPPISETFQSENFVQVSAPQPQPPVQEHNAQTDSYVPPVPPQPNAGPTQSEYNAQPFSQQTNQQPIQQPMQQNGYQQQTYAAYNPMPHNPEDKRSIGLNVLGWFVPLFGFIYYFVERKEKPIRAKSVLKTTIISVVVNVVLTFILSFAIVFGSMSIANKQTAGSDFNEDTYTVITEEPKTVVDTNNSFDITFYDDEISLPCSVATLLEKYNLTLEKNDTLEPGGVKSMGVYNKSENMVCYVELHNDSNTNLKATESTIYAILLHNNSDKSIKIDSDLFIGKKCSKEDLENRFGPANDAFHYSSDDGTYVTDEYTFFKGEGDNAYSLYVTLKDGMIYSLSMYAPH